MCGRIDGLSGETEFWFSHLKNVGLNTNGQERHAVRELKVPRAFLLPVIAK